MCYKTKYEHTVPHLKEGKIICKQDMKVRAKWFKGGDTFYYGIK